MTALVSFLLRFVQAAVTASPYIFTGVLLVGFLRLMCGPERLRRWLTGDQLSAPLKATGFAVLLPLCSLSALPVSRELLRAQIPRRSVFVFTLCAPLFHPLTLAYGLSVMDLSLLLALLAGAFVVVLFASRWLPDGASEPAALSVVDEQHTQYGIRRMAAILVVAAEQLRPRYLAEIAVGLTGAGLVGALFAPDAIGSLLAPDSLFAAPVSAGVGAALYMTPEQAIGVFDQMFGHGNSLAAVFALLIFGAGMNLGTILGLSHLFGIRATTCSLTALLLGAIVFGSIANATIYTPHIEAGGDHAGHEGKGHTHAFDSFGRDSALRNGLETTNVPALFTKVGDAATWSLLGCLVVLACAAQAMQRSGVDSRIRRMLNESASAQQKSWSRPLPNSWIRGIVGLLVIAGSYAIAITYFPAPAEVFAEMRIVRADALAELRLGRHDSAEQYLLRWEELARELPIGALLRGVATGEQRVSAQRLRQNLIRIRSEIVREDADALQARLADCEIAYRQCREVFAGNPLPALHSLSGPSMPDKVSDDAERDLYLTPGGIYSSDDILANGSQTASHRYAGFQSEHDMDPAPGADLCPVTETKANKECIWIVNGKTYQFCCPPCIDEFVKWAKESPETIKDPSEYVKR